MNYSLYKGVFTTGDAYLAVDADANVIYIWLGKKCSVDEKGAAAVQARNINDEKFSGGARIETYDEDLEDPEILRENERTQDY